MAKGRQESLEGSLEQQKTVANASSEASVKLRELERDAEAARGVYESLIKRAAETRQQESLQVADARIVNPAVEPLSPVGPRKLKLALIGFAAGFALSFALSALIELHVADLRAAAGDRGPRALAASGERAAAFGPPRRSCR